MPFEIEKGYGTNEIKKSVPHPIVRDSDMAYISPPSDLAELWNLKLYHISHKKKGNGKLQKRLVGEQYLRENEVLGVVKKAKAKDVLDATSSELQTYGHAKISNLLRKIRKLKVKNYVEHGHQKEIIERLQLSSAEPRAISAGKPIFQGFKDRTLKETLDWAFEYVDGHLDTLPPTLFGVVDELRSYATWKEKNRLLKAGIVDPNQATPRRKGAVLHTEAGAAQTDTGHLPFRRPKNVSLLDQLNRIDMIGFNRLLEVIGGKNDSNSPPRQRLTGVWTPNTPQAPRGQRPVSTSAPRRGSISSSSQTPKQAPKLDEGSVAKPVAGAYGSSTAASSHPPSSRGRPQTATNMSPKKDSKPRPASATHAHARPPEKPKPSHKTQAVPAQRSFEPKPPSASSSFGRRNHRKSVLVPSQGMEGQILTDDDTALLVKVDRRDSNHRVNPITNNRWGSQTATTDTTTQPDDEEGDAGAPHRGGVTRFVGASAEDDDNLSDFGSLYHHGGKTAAATYSNGVDQITTNWDSLHLYRFNPDFNANEIQDTKIRAYYQRGLLREEYLKTQQNHTFATITKAEITSEHLVNVWEEISNIDSVECQKMNAILNQKDFNRTTMMKTLHDCFLMEGSDRKLGKLGSTLMVDLLSMKRRAKHRIYCQKMESLSKAVWFITILTKLRDHTKKSFQKIPISLFKFLGIIHILLMYGWSFNTELFWMLIDNHDDSSSHSHSNSRSNNPKMKTIEPQDHKEIIVHRTIKAIREYLKISPEVFMKYLDSHGIQPCSELLAQIREIKQQRTRAVRAQQLKAARIGLYSPRLKATLNRHDLEQTAAVANDDKEEGKLSEGKSLRRGSPPDVASLPPQSQQKHLSMIREQSESTNYGIEYNSLTPMRKAGNAAVAGAAGDTKKVAFATALKKMNEEKSDDELSFFEDHDHEDGDQLSPLGSLMSFGSGVLPDIVELGVPKRL